MTDIVNTKLDGKSINLRLTDSATRALEEKSQPLYVEMELYFSCLIRKKVRFNDAPEVELFTPVSDKLNLRFRPVMTQRCHIDELEDAPPLTDFPMADEKRFIPHWLEIDYRKGEWLGDFGY
jgi:hypothetical protein